MENNKTRIIVNARFLTQEITGVQRFAIEISLRLRQRFDENTLIFFAPHNILHNTISEELKAVIVGKKTGHLWEQCELPFHLKTTDLLVNFCNTAPIFHTRKIVTIHDLAFLENKTWHKKRFRLFYKLLIPIIIKTSIRFFTVSNTMKKELTKYYSLQNKKINILYNATSLPLILTPKKNDKTERYILFVGSQDPRKNLETLIKSFDYVADKQLKLKIIGGKSKSFKTVNLEAFDNRIEFLGRQSDIELQILYRNAVAFIYPSFYEGFGIPILEALSNYCPVLASDIPVFREIYSNTLSYFNPHDKFSIAQSINKIILEDGLNIKQKKAIHKLLTIYSWDRSAEACIQVIVDECI
ncbi:MAG: glycosyltransferase family 1 protein [Bacteroidales bacterium]|nr:glycosyltransferase family 1 protein [Bacteroidales bacterium]